MVAKKPGTTTKKPTASAEPPAGAGWAGPPETTPVVAAPRGPEVMAPAGRAVAIGRDGKPMWRQSVPGNGTDQFAAAASYAPQGWVYEWKRHSIYNSPQTTYQSTIQRVGRWSPVPADRHPGVFGPPDMKGSIIHDGLILMERPWALHEEAKNEEKRTADGEVNRAKRERGLTPASPGIATNTAAARDATFVKESRALEDEHFMEDLSAAKPSYDRNVNTID